jgi:hypothetical protein
MSDWRFDRLVDAEIVKTGGWNSVSTLWYPST